LPTQGWILNTNQCDNWKLTFFDIVLSSFFTLVLQLYKRLYVTITGWHQLNLMSLFVVPFGPLISFDVVNTGQYGNTYLVTSFCDVRHVLDSSLWFSR
jgi:hypothetical protein